MTTAGPLSAAAVDVLADADALLGALGATADSAGAEVGGAGSRVPVGAVLGAGVGSATALGKGGGRGFGIGLGLVFWGGLAVGSGLDCGAGLGAASATGWGSARGSGSGVIRVAITSTGTICAGGVGLGSRCNPHRPATCASSTAKQIDMFWPRRLAAKG